MDTKQLGWVSLGLFVIGAGLWLVWDTPIFGWSFIVLGMLGFVMWSRRKRLEREASAEQKTDNSG